MIASALAISSASFLAPAHAQGTEAMMVSVPAGPLGSTMNALARQFGVSLSVNAADVTNRYAPAINGHLRFDEAAEIALRGSGLTVARSGKNAVISAPASRRGGDQTMAPVSVVAGADSSRQIAQGYKPRGAAVGSLMAESVLDTPRTVSVYGRELMNDLQVTDLNQLIRYDPAVRFGSSWLGLNRQFLIRGMGINVNSNYRQDGSVTRWAEVPLEAMEQVEILKGTSALLYGFSTPGGVINFVTKKPTAEPLTRVHLGLNQYGNNLQHLDLSRRFGEQGSTGLRVNVAREGVQTYVSENSGERYMGSVTLEQRFTSQAKLSLHADYQRSDREGGGYWLSGAGATSVPPLLNPRTFYSQSWAREDATRNTQSIKLDYALADQWLFTGHVQRLTINSKSNYAIPGAVQANGDYTTTRSFNGQFDSAHLSTRWQIEGKVQTGAIVHNVVASYSTYGLDREGAAASALAGTNNIYHPAPIAEPAFAAAPVRYRQFRLRQSTVTLANRIEFNPMLSLLLGVNHVDYDLQSFNVVGLTTTNYQTTRLSPTAALILKPQADTSAYLSYSESLESGGTAPVTAANANQTLRPALAKQYELGLKHEWSKGFMTSASLFSMERQNAYVNATNVYAADGREKYQGAELSVAGQISNTLRLIGGYQYLDAKVKNAADPNLLNKIPLNVARHTLSLFADQSLRHYVGGLSVQGGVNYVGSRPANTVNSLFIPGYTTWDVGVAYETRLGGKPAKLRLLAENLADKRYFSNSSYGYLDYGAPRMVRASLQIDL